MTSGLPWALPWPWRSRDASAAEKQPRSAASPSAVADVGAQARFGGDDEEPTEWVPVYWASAMEEAHVVRGVLETEDVPAILKHESRVAYGSAALGGVQVLVPRPLEDRAREILED